MACGLAFLTHSAARRASLVDRSAITGEPYQRPE